MRLKAMTKQQDSQHADKHRYFCYFQTT